MLAGNIGEYTNSTLGLFDMWIFSLYVQFGLVGSCFFVTFWLYPIAQSLFNKNCLRKEYYSFIYVAGFLTLSPFAYAHGASILHRLFIPIIVLSFAVFYVLRLNNIKNNH